MVKRNSRKKTIRRNSRKFNRKTRRNSKKFNRKSRRNSKKFNRKSRRNSRKFNRKSRRNSRKVNRKSRRYSRKKSGGMFKGKVAPSTDPSTDEFLQQAMDARIKRQGDFAKTSSTQPPIRISPAIDWISEEPGPPAQKVRAEGVVERIKDTLPSLPNFDIEQEQVPGTMSSSEVDLRTKYGKSSDPVENFRQGSVEFAENPLFAAQRNKLRGELKDEKAAEQELERHAAELIRKAKEKKLKSR